MKHGLKKLYMMNGMLWDFMNECPKWRISSGGCVIYTFLRNCIMVVVVVVTMTTATVMIMFMDMMMMMIVVIIKSWGGEEEDIEDGNYDNEETNTEYEIK